jgi:predicted metal-dependent enzyme (double-stranded beta helix superfamily)
LQEIETMFDREQFIADCRLALEGERASRNVREVVARAVSDPDAVIHGLGELKPGGIEAVHRSPELTIINVCWPPHMVIMPHNHAMWAVIGVYSGREDNILWRRLSAAADGKIEAAGAMALSTKDAVALGSEVIHSVTNPIPRVTGAIHVYGGDFFGVQRSEWDPDSLREKPLDLEKALRMFER